MRRWSKSAWMRWIAGTTAWFLSMGQAVPIASALSYDTLRQVPTSKSPLLRNVVGDPLFAKSLADQLFGVDGMPGEGDRIVEPARAEKRLFLLAGGEAVSIEDQVNAYATEYQRRTGLHFEGIPALVARLQRLADAVGPTAEPVWVIHDELQAAPLAEAGGIGSLMHRALAAHGLASRAVYLSNLTLLDTLLDADAARGQAVIHQLVQQGLASLQARTYHELAPDEVTGINASIAAAYAAVKAGRDKAALTTLVEDREATVRRAAARDPVATFETADLGAFFPDGRMPADVAVKLNALLTGLVEGGRLSQAELRPSAGGVTVKASYRRAEPDAAAEAITQITELVRQEAQRARQGRVQAPSAAPAPVLDPQTAVLHLQRLVTAATTAGRPEVAEQAQGLINQLTISPADADAFVLARALLTEHAKLMPVSGGAGLARTIGALSYDDLNALASGLQELARRASQDRISIYQSSTSTGTIAVIWDGREFEFLLDNTGDDIRQWATEPGEQAGARWANTDELRGQLRVLLGRYFELAPLPEAAGELPPVDLRTALRVEEPTPEVMQEGGGALVSIVEVGLGQGTLLPEWLEEAFSSLQLGQTLVFSPEQVEALKGANRLGMLDELAAKFGLVARRLSPEQAGARAYEYPVGVGAAGPKEISAAPVSPGQPKAPARIETIKWDSMSRERFINTGTVLLEDMRGSRHWDAPSVEQVVTTLVSRANPDEKRERDVIARDVMAFIRQEAAKQNGLTNLDVAVYAWYRFRAKRIGSVTRIVVEDTYDVSLPLMERFFASLRSMQQLDAAPSVVSTFSTEALDLLAQKYKLALQRTMTSLQDEDVPYGTLRFVPVEGPETALRALETMKPGETVVLSEPIADVLAQAVDFAGRYNKQVFTTSSSKRLDRESNPRVGLMTFRRPGRDLKPGARRLALDPSSTGGTTARTITGNEARQFLLEHLPGYRVMELDFVTFGTRFYQPIVQVDQTLYVPEEKDGWRVFRPAKQDRIDIDAKGNVLYHRASRQGGGVSPTYEQFMSIGAGTIRDIRKQTPAAGQSQAIALALAGLANVPMQDRGSYAAKLITLMPGKSDAQVLEEAWTLSEALRSARAGVDASRLVIVHDAGTLTAAFENLKPNERLGIPRQVVDATKGGLTTVDALAKKWGLDRLQEAGMPVYVHSALASAAPITPSTNDTAAVTRILQAVEDGIMTPEAAVQELQKRPGMDEAAALATLRGLSAQPAPSSAAPVSVRTRAQAALAKALTEFTHQTIKPEDVKGRYIDLPGVRSAVQQEEQGMLALVKTIEGAIFTEFPEMGMTDRLNFTSKFEAVQGGQKYYQSVAETILLVEQYIQTATPGDAGSTKTSSGSGNPTISGVLGPHDEYLDRDRLKEADGEVVPGAQRSQLSSATSGLPAGPAGTISTYADVPERIDGIVAAPVQGLTPETTARWDQLLGLSDAEGEYTLFRTATETLLAKVHRSADGRRINIRYLPTLSPAARQQMTGGIALHYERPVHFIPVPRPAQMGGLWIKRLSPERVEVEVVPAQSVETFRELPSAAPAQDEVNEINGRVKRVIADVLLGSLNHAQPVPADEITGGLWTLLLGGKEGRVAELAALQTLSPIELALEKEFGVPLPDQVQFRETLGLNDPTVTVEEIGPSIVAWYYSATGPLRGRSRDRNRVDPRMVPAPRTERELAWLLSYYWGLPQPYDAVTDVAAHQREGEVPTPEMMQHLQRLTKDGITRGLRVRNKEDVFFTAELIGIGTNDVAQIAGIFEPQLLAATPPSAAASAAKPGAAEDQVEQELHTLRADVRGQAETILQDFEGQLGFVRLVMEESSPRIADVRDAVHYFRQAAVAQLQAIGIENDRAERLVALVMERASDSRGGAPVGPPVTQRDGASAGTASPADSAITGILQAVEDGTMTAESAVQELQKRSGMDEAAALVTLRGLSAQPAPGSAAARPTRHPKYELGTLEETVRRKAADILDAYEAALYGLLLQDFESDEARGDQIRRMRMETLDQFTKSGVEPDRADQLMLSMEQYVYGPGVGVKKAAPGADRWQEVRKAIAEINAGSDVPLALEATPTRAGRDVAIVVDRGESEANWLADAPFTIRFEWGAEVTPARLRQAILDADEAGDLPARAIPVLQRLVDRLGPPVTVGDGGVAKEQAAAGSKEVSGAPVREGSVTVRLRSAIARGLDLQPVQVQGVLVDLKGTPIPGGWEEWQRTWLHDVWPSIFSEFQIREGEREALARTLSRSTTLEQLAENIERVLAARAEAPSTPSPAPKGTGSGGSISGMGLGAEGGRIGDEYLDRGRLKDVDGEFLTGPQRSQLSSATSGQPAGPAGIGAPLVDSIGQLSEEERTAFLREYRELGGADAPAITYEPDRLIPLAEPSDTGQTVAERRVWVGSHTRGDWFWENATAPDGWADTQELRVELWALLSRYYHLTPVNSIAQLSEERRDAFLREYRALGKEGGQSITYDPEIRMSLASGTEITVGPPTTGDWIWLNASGWADTEVKQRELWDLLSRHDMTPIETVPDWLKATPGGGGTAGTATISMGAGPEQEVDSSAPVSVRARAQAALTKALADFTHQSIKPEDVKGRYINLPGVRSAVKQEEQGMLALVKTIEGAIFAEFPEMGQRDRWNFTSQFEAVQGGQKYYSSVEETILLVEQYIQTATPGDAGSTRTSSGSGNPTISEVMGPRDEYLDRDRLKEADGEVVPRAKASQLSSAASGLPVGGAGVPVVQGAVAAEVTQVMDELDAWPSYGLVLALARHFKLSRDQAYELKRVLNAALWNAAQSQLGATSQQPRPEPRGFHLDDHLSFKRLETIEAAQTYLTPVLQKRHGQIRKAFADGLNESPNFHDVKPEEALGRFGGLSGRPRELAAPFVRDQLAKEFAISPGKQQDLFIGLDLSDDAPTTEWAIEPIIRDFLPEAVMPEEQDEDTASPTRTPGVEGTGSGGSISGMIPHDAYMDGSFGPVVGEPFRPRDPGNVLSIGSGTPDRSSGRVAAGSQPKTFIAVSTEGRRVTDDENREMDAALKQKLGNELFPAKRVLQFGPGTPSLADQLPDDGALRYRGKRAYEFLMVTPADRAGIRRIALVASDDLALVSNSNGDLHVIASAGNWPWQGTLTSLSTHYLTLGLVERARRAWGDERALEFFLDLMDYIDRMLRTDTFPTAWDADIQKGFSELAAYQYQQPEIVSHSGLSLEQNAGVRDFVAQYAQFLDAGAIELVGEDDEARLREEAINAGEAYEEQGTNRLFTFSHPSDTARTVPRTFVATSHPDDKGLNNNWRHTDEIRPQVEARMNGSLRGGAKQLYVIPYLRDPDEAPTDSNFLGVELTDSRYVALNMIQLYRSGQKALDLIGKSKDFRRIVHSAGDLEQLTRDFGKDDDRFYVAFPEENLVLLTGSGYGGNAIGPKKFDSLRLDMAAASREGGWLAEHQAFVVFRNKQTGKTLGVTFAAPSQSGKTNFAMMQLPDGLKDLYDVWVVSDDLVTMRIGRDGRLRAKNPENGLFAVIPDTNWQSNPNAMVALGEGENAQTGTLFTNIAVNMRRNATTGRLEVVDHWWDGLTAQPPWDQVGAEARQVSAGELAADEGWRDWQFKRIRSRTDAERGQEWAQSNSRGTTRLRNVPSWVYNLPKDQWPAEWNDPAGIPVDLVLFGGRRSDTEVAFRLLPDAVAGIADGFFMGAEGTTAGEGEERQFFADPFAQRPFFSVTEPRHVQMWLDIKDQLGDQAPRFGHLNAFRRGPNREWLYPGYGHNAYFVAWLDAYRRGDAKGIETPIGILPTVEELQRLPGMDVPGAQLAAALVVNLPQWEKELERQTAYYEKNFGEKLPLAIRRDLDRRRNAFAAYRRALAEPVAQWLAQQLRGDERSVDVTPGLADVMQRAGLSWDIAEHRQAVGKALHDLRILEGVEWIRQEHPVRPLVEGNLKANTVKGELETYYSTVLASTRGPNAPEVTLFVPDGDIQHIRNMAIRYGFPTNVAVGAQNVSEVPAEGPFTGEAVASMLVRWGATRVLVGHSERRTELDQSTKRRIRVAGKGETHQTIVAKMKNALAQKGVRVTLAVGETFDERQAGRTFEVIEEQLREEYGKLTPEEQERVDIAYEPVWAIGTGATSATPEQVEEVHRFIRVWLAGHAGLARSAATRITYGGNVNPGNIDGFLAKPNVDGVLVGGASLDAGSFSKIIEAAPLAIAGAEIEAIPATPSGDTFRTRVRLKNGVIGEWFGLPAGTSTGLEEAWTIGLKEAIRLIQDVILPRLRASGIPADQLVRIHDEVLVPLNEEVARAAGRDPIRWGGIGGDTVLSFETALAYAVAKARGVELADFLMKSFPDAAAPGDTRLLSVVWSGGEHVEEGSYGVDKFSIQEILIDSSPTRSLRQAKTMVRDIREAVEGSLKARGVSPGESKEGGVAPRGIGSIKDALRLVINAARSLGYEPGRDFKIDLDAAANSFYDEDRAERGEPAYNFDGRWVDREGLLLEYQALDAEFSGLVRGVEDPFYEKDHAGWRRLKEVLPHWIRRADDVTASQLDLVDSYADLYDELLVKANQAGSLVDTMRVIARAKQLGKPVVISHRSREAGRATEEADVLMAHLAFAAGAPLMKTMPWQPVRTAKVDKLIELQERPQNDRIRRLGEVLRMSEGPAVENAMYEAATHLPSPEGTTHGRSWEELLQAFYAAGVDDQFIPPLVRVDEEGRPASLIKDGDALIYWDYRTDRAKPLTAAFLGVPAEGQVGGLSDQAAVRPRVLMVTMTHYDDRFTASSVPSDRVPLEAFNPSAPIADTYAEVMGKAGVSQLVVGESEKWRAVTWFKDGRRNLGYQPVSYENGVRVERHAALPITVKVVDSRKVASHIAAPQMRTAEISALVTQGINEGVGDIFVNYANADMVGHAMADPSQFDQVVEGILALDQAMGEVVPAALARGYTVLITADHGNAEQMLYPDGKANPAHTTNPVPLILLGLEPEESVTIKPGTTIGDIAPTVAQLRGMTPPASWTRTSALDGTVHGRADRKILRIVLDGYGLRDGGEDNAMAVAARRKGSPLHIDRWMRGEDRAVAAAIDASGEANGYPAGNAGTTEFGHVLFDAGRTIGSDQGAIDLAIRTGEFDRNPALLKAIHSVRDAKTSLHLMGILSDGQVHASLAHLEAVLRLAAAEGLRKDQVKIHVITDGRDVAGDSAPRYLAWLDEVIAKYGVGEVVSIWGRGWGKDRDNRWQRIEAAYRSLTEGTAALHVDLPRRPSPPLRTVSVEPMTFPDRMSRFGIQTGDPLDGPPIARAGTWGALRSYLDETEWMAGAVSEDRGWIVVSVSTLADPRATAALQSRLEQQERLRGLGFAEQSRRVAVVVEDIPWDAGVPPGELRKALGAVLDEVMAASGGTLGIRQSDIQVLPNVPAEILEPLLAAAWPGSRVTAAVVEGSEAAADLHRALPALSAEAVQAFPRGGFATLEMVEAAVIASLARRLPNELVKRLEKAAEILPQSHDLETPAIEADDRYRQRVRAAIAAAIKG